MKLNEPDWRQRLNALTSDLFAFPARFANNFGIENDQWRVRFTVGPYYTQSSRARERDLCLNKLSPDGEFEVEVSC